MNFQGRIDKRCRWSLLIPLGALLCFSAALLLGSISAALAAEEENLPVASDAEAAPRRDLKPYNNLNELLYPCRPGRVTYEGGAIVCPTCEMAVTNFQFDSKYDEEVNGHMKKALAGDVDSAKWLMAYFSDPAHRNYVEAKKWFGRALGIGANGAELSLPDGYDEPYMTTAQMELGHFNIKVSTSCSGLDTFWKPNCYAQMLHFPRMRGKPPAEAYYFDLNSGQKPLGIRSLKSIMAGNHIYLIAEIKNALNEELIRVDYYKDGDLVGFDDLGSSDDLKVFFPRPRPSQWPGLLDKKEPSLELDEVKKSFENTTDCQVYDLSWYPVVNSLENNDTPVKTD